MERRSLLALCLLSVIPAGNADIPLLLTIPSVLKGGEPGKTCLTVKQHEDSVDVQAILEVGETNHTVINDQIPPGGSFKNYEFQVPEVKQPTPAFLLISAVSGNSNYTARRSVILVPPGNVAFILTDKQLYKNGQKVKIYVMAMDNNLRPVEETFPEILVTNPSGNLIYQWLDQSTTGSFLSLTFTILEDAELGSYQIIAKRQSGALVTKSIKTEKYVLPKFKVTLTAPSIVTILHKNISVQLNARYTYDQGVPGQISGRLCRPPTNYYSGNTCNRSPDGICVPFTGTTDSEGTFKGNVDLSTFQLDRSGYEMSFILQVTLTEQGTNVQATETKTISITSQLGRARFDDEVMRTDYKKGINYTVGIVVENAQGQPESGQLVEVQMDGKFLQNLTSDERGKAQCDVDTSTFTTSNVNFRLIYKNQEQCYDGNWIVPTYANDYRSVGRFFSRTVSFMQLQGPKGELQCGQMYNIKVQYSIGKDALAAEETTIKIAYMVIARSKIVESGEHAVDVSQSLKGEFNLPYLASASHAPTVQFAVHYMLKDELVGDALNLNLEKCFENQVSANFTSPKETPGSRVGLAMKTSSDSSCLVNIVDSSLLILNAGQTFSAATVYSSLQYTSLNGFSAAGFHIVPPQPPCIENNQILFNGTYWQIVDFPEENDVHKVFSRIGMHMITAVPSQQPQLCSRFNSFRPVFEQPSMGFSGIIFSDSAPARGTTNAVSENVAVAPVTSMRTSFPEVWYSGIMHVGANGSMLNLEVPGTITEWKGDMTCLSNGTGFGMTKYPANFTAFQKFFADLSHPDSIVRGEIMRVVASAANYLDKCAKVQVTLQSSDAYVAEPIHMESVKCVCSQERATFSWKINATTIGVANVSVTAETILIGDSCEGPADPNEPNYKDTIVQSFVVTPEGLKQEVTKTNFVCVKGSNAFVEVNLNPSGSIVPGSMSAKFQVMGDLLGRVLQNPEDVIKGPTGCGEQVVATLMPIPLAMKYLSLTGRLTEELRKRAVQHMSDGYVRLMNYRNYDGSFSAFGQGRSKPSGWLTVLALQTLWDIKPYTYVAEIFEQGVLFLERLQDLNTGAFNPVGTLFNGGLKGGADDKVGFTCAVVMFLSRTAYAASPSLLRPALAYLDTASRMEQSVYNYAMLFNVFRVSGNVERANAMREKLNTLAIEDGDGIHWQRIDRPNQQTPYMFSPQVGSGEIEITARVLQGWAYGESTSTVSAEDLNKMAKISNWLVRYQNIHGSYSTTSDSMAVLNAMCAYGALVYQKNATNTVQLKYGDQVLRQFNVDESSRILLQTEVLPQVPGNYSMVVSGNGCVLMQTGVVFHVPVKLQNSAFSLSVTTFPENCQNGVAYLVDCQVNASYHGIHNKSNMAVIMVPLFSGYIMEDRSLSKLQSQFPKVEQKNNNLIVYLLEVTSEGVSFNMTLEMRPRVENFQPITVIAYDFYEKEENGVAVMYHPCTPSG